MSKTPNIQLYLLNAKSLKVLITEDQVCISFYLILKKKIYFRVFSVFFFFQNVWIPCIFTVYW